MWGTLEKMATKALAYSTPLGMAWFFILFIFRMFVVAVVGGAVYGDEAVSYIQGSPDKRSSSRPSPSFNNISRVISNAIRHSPVVKMFASTDSRRFLTCDFGHFI